MFIFGCISHLNRNLLLITMPSLDKVQSLSYCLLHYKAEMQLQNELRSHYHCKALMKLEIYT